MQPSTTASILALSILLPAAGQPGSSEVQVADFEDVATLQTGFVLPTRDGFAYAGLIWNGFYVINSDHGITKQFPRGGYRTGKVSGRFAGVGSLRNVAHTEIYPESETRFDIVSLYITSAWRDGLLVRLEGLRGGTSVLQKDLTLQAGKRQRLELRFDDLDAFRISAAGGEDAGLCEGTSCSPGPEVVLDDVVFRVHSKQTEPKPPPVVVSELRQPAAAEPALEPKPTPAPETAPPPAPVQTIAPEPPEPRPQPPVSASEQADEAAARQRALNQIASGVCGAKPYYGAQVGAFSSKPNALGLAAKLRGQDTLVQIHEKSRGEKGPLFYVVAGCFDEKAHATQLAEQIKEDGMDCYVTRASIGRLGPLVED